MSRLAAPLSLLFLSLLVFANTLNHPFVHDDIVFIVQNPHIARFDDLPRLFYHSPAPSPAGINAYYRPLLEIAYRLEYVLYGLDPAGWHLSNVLLHGLNGILVYHLLGLLGFAGFLPWAAAALFVVHPVQTEAVACVAGISNLLMAFWVLLTLILYLKDRWFLALGCFALALLTKEQALMVLPLIVLIDWYRGLRPPLLWGAFVAAALGFLALRQGVTGAHVWADIMASPGELKLRVLAIAQVLGTDVRLLLFPSGLHYYRSTDILSVNVLWWPVAILTGLLAWRAGKVARFGALWFVLALLPVLNIAPLINEYSLILTAEHFLYLPMIGIAVIVCHFVIPAHTARVPLRGAGIQNRVFLLLFTAVLAAVSIHQNTFWRSETALFERTMAFEPNFARGHLLLAKAYYFDKRYTEADKHFARAYAIMKDYEKKADNRTARRFYQGFMKGILFDWAHSLEAQGRLEEAKKNYRDAIAIDPSDPVLCNNLRVLEQFKSTL